MSVMLEGLSSAGLLLQELAVPQLKGVCVQSIAAHSTLHTLAIGKLSLPQPLEQFPVLQGLRVLRVGDFGCIEALQAVLASCRALQVLHTDTMHTKLSSPVSFTLPFLKELSFGLLDVECLPALLAPDMPALESVCFQLCMEGRPSGGLCSSLMQLVDAGKVDALPFKGKLAGAAPLSITNCACSDAVQVLSTVAGTKLSSLLIDMKFTSCFVERGDFSAWADCVCPHTYRLNLFSCTLAPGMLLDVVRSLMCLSSLTVYSCMGKGSSDSQILAAAQYAALCKWRRGQPLTISLASWLAGPLRHEWLEMLIGGLLGCASCPVRIVG